MHSSARTHIPDTPCIWMQAGVVKKKRCEHHYNCYECNFDKAMLRAWRKKKIIHWKDALRSLPSYRRPCIHSMKKRIGFRRCINDYQCSCCEVNEYFEDIFQVNTTISPVEMLNIWGITFPQGYYLYPSHLWVRLQGRSEALIGLDDFVLKIIGPLDSIKVPLMGKEVRKDKRHITINKGAFSARLPFPLSGVVLETNPSLWHTGGWRPENPYGEWLVRINSPSLVKEIGSLMLGEEGVDLMKRDLEFIIQHIERIHGPLAADGGLIRGVLYEAMPHLDWKMLFSKLFERRRV